MNRRALADHLRGQPIARIVSSPLQRAVETAQILSAALSAPVTQHDALREWMWASTRTPTIPAAGRCTARCSGLVCAWSPDARMPEGESQRHAGALCPLHRAGHRCR
ncbi:MAG: histidine phosphatase family protein [Caldilineaceae bacterium]